MEYVECFITIKLIWHSYLVLSLNNCANKTSTETGLICWKVWMERNTHIFNRTKAPYFVVPTKIRDETVKPLLHCWTHEAPPIFFFVMNAPREEIEVVYKWK